MPLYFGMFVSVAAYLVGMALKKKLGWAILNPLLVAILLVMALLKATGISYGDYNQGASYISYFLTPATVCLAIPLYKQLELLKKILAAVLCGITTGVAGSVLSIFAMSLVFRLEHVHYVSLLPKSITTAIGMGVAEEAGGIVTITIVSIIFTGILGNIVAEGWFKLVGIREPIAKGLRQALDLCGKVSDYNKVVKDLNKALDEKCRARYDSLTDEDIKNLLVNKKWFDSIFSGIADLYAAISHRLTNRIVELAERYENTLPELDKDTTEYEAKVKSHLERMGFKW